MTTDDETSTTGAANWLVSHGRHCLDLWEVKFKNTPVDCQPGRFMTTSLRCLVKNVAGNVIFASLQERCGSVTKLSNRCINFGWKSQEPNVPARCWFHITLFYLTSQQCVRVFGGVRSSLHQSHSQEVHLRESRRQNWRGIRKQCFTGRRRALLFQHTL